jgi:predicted dehydrogenase
LDEATLILRMTGNKPERITYPVIDVLRAELDAFADAIEKKAPFPVPEAEVLATLSAFEAALRSMTSGVPVFCHGG